MTQSTNNVANILKSKFNIIFDTSVYFRFIDKLYEKYRIKSGTKARKISDNHIKFLENLLEKVHETNGCIYIYTEDKSNGKALDKEYKDLQEKIRIFVADLKRTKPDIGSYNVIVSKFLKFLEFSNNVITEEKKLNNGCIIIALKKYFVLLLFKLIFPSTIKKLMKSCRNYDCICYVYFSNHNRSLNALNKLISILKSATVSFDCYTYDNILYDIFQNVYSINYCGNVAYSYSRVKCYEDHLKYLISSNYIQQELLEDIHMLLTPVIFNDNTLNVFDPDNYCKCNSEFIDDDRCGIISVITYGKCEEGDAELFIDKTVSINLLNIHKRNLGRSYSDLVNYMCGGFIPIKTNDESICFSIIYLCEK